MSATVRPCPGVAAGQVLAARAAITIEREPHAVWSFVSDYARDAAWRAGIVEMTPEHSGPPYVGMRTHEVLRLAGREYVTDAAITEVGPDLRLCFAGSGTSGAVRGQRSVIPTTVGHSLFTYEVEVEPDGVPRFARRFLRWYLERNMRRDVARLKSIVESTP